VVAEAPGAGSGPNPDGAPGGRRGGPSQEELLAQFDKDGDGQLNETEQAAMRTAMAARIGGQRGPRLSPEERLKRFDKDGDGKLDESEQAAMRAALGGGRSGPARARDDNGARPRGPRGDSAAGDGLGNPSVQPQGEDGKADPKTP
jgi:hypothetical protein